MGRGAGGKTFWRAAELATLREAAFDMAPDAAARGALAGELGILGVRSLRFHGRLLPEGGGDARLEARIEAEVEQACVVTLDPVRTKLAEPVVRRFLAEVPVPEEDEAEMPGDESIEAIGAGIDLAEVMREALALALPPWPRAPGAGPGDAAFGPDGAPEDPDAALRPFGDLARMMGKTPPDA
ncbi:MAG: YceD family protein [Paracoccaceae bacterium]